MGKRGRKGSGGRAHPGCIKVNIDPKLAARARAYKEVRNLSLGALVERALRNEMKGFLPDARERDGDDAGAEPGEVGQAA